MKPSTRWSCTLAKGALARNRTVAISTTASASRRCGRVAGIVDRKTPSSGETNSIRKNFRAPDEESHLTKAHSGPFCHVCRRDNVLRLYNSDHSQELRAELGEIAVFVRKCVFYNFLRCGLASNRGRSRDCWTGDNLWSPSRQPDAT